MGKLKFPHVVIFPRPWVFAGETTIHVNWDWTPSAMSKVYKTLINDYPYYIFKIPGFK